MWHTNKPIEDLSESPDPEKLIQPDKSPGALKTEEGGFLLTEDGGKLLEDPPEESR